MTQEEKEVLLADLCTRLPYEVKVDHFGTVKELLGIMPSSENVMVGYDINDYEDSVIEDIKPYLRPLSSMTEEEHEEYRKYVKAVNGFTYNINCSDLMDWYNRKMFDYRGLIPKGFAIEAPEGMYNN